MPIFDTSRLRRCISFNELRDELALMLESLDKTGFRAPLLITTVGNEPLIKGFMPNADLEVIPPIQLRSGTELREIPAFPSDHNPVPLPPIPGAPVFTPTPFPPPWGQAVPDIDRTDGATTPDPQEEAWFQPPMPALGKVTGGASPNWTVEVYLSAPVDGIPYMENVTATDLNAALALVPGNWVELTLVFPLSLLGGALAYIAEP